MSAIDLFFFNNFQTREIDYNMPEVIIDLSENIIQSSMHPKKFFVHVRTKLSPCLLPGLILTKRCVKIQSPRRNRNRMPLLSFYVVQCNDYKRVK